MDLNMDFKILKYRFVPEIYFFDFRYKKLLSSQMLLNLLMNSQMAFKQWLVNKVLRCLVVDKNKG